LEVCFDNLLEFVEPGFFQVVAGLGDAGGLNLFEFVHLHGLGYIGVVDVFGRHVIALLPDVLLSPYNLIVARQGFKAELGENLVEVV
jgi:hypothetical protein